MTRRPASSHYRQAPIGRLPASALLTAACLAGVIWIARHIHQWLVETPIVDMAL